MNKKNIIMDESFAILGKPAFDGVFMRCNYRGA